MSMTAYSSSFSDDDPKYDVFISFRGDTRRKFTSHLYCALREEQIKTYIDEVSLKKGDDISRALPKAIEESAISMIIFSKNYASSTWCLDELVHILKCKKEKAQIVLPIFLDVNPSDIRKQKNSYAAAFRKHRKRFKRRPRFFCLSYVARKRFKKVPEWRQALKKASKLSGWDSRGKHEADIVKEVVKDVQEKLKLIGSNGWIQYLLKPLKTMLRSAHKVLKYVEEKQIEDEMERLLDMKEVIFRADKLMEKINYEERRKLEGASESSTSFVTFNKPVEDKIAEILVKLKELTAQKDVLGPKEHAKLNLDLCLGRKENPLFTSPSSSSGVDPSLCKYDVFISFRGDDPRHNFTSHLYSALRRNQIRAFTRDEVSLERGDDVSRALAKAIEESAISIIIFSTNYASSIWCLDELVHILKCRKEKDQIVVPIFYGVDPADIRKQKRSYAAAFVEHEQRFVHTIDKVHEWRGALLEATGLCGWDSLGQSESHLIERVVEDVEMKLKYIRSNDRIKDLLLSLKAKL